MVISRCGAAAFLFFVVVGACGSGASPEANGVERQDSGGVAITRNTAGDTILDWTFEKRWTLGRGQGESPDFFRVLDETVSADTSGRLFVLDVGNHTVYVFDDEGRFTEAIGGRGGGPGEFLFPISMAVAPDGEISVVDVGKTALVRFDPDFEPVPEIHLASPYLVSPTYIDGHIASVLQRPSVPGDSVRQELVLLTDSTPLVLSTTLKSPPRRVDLGCTEIRGLPPVFEHDLQFAVAGTHVIVAPEPSYELRLLDLTGVLQQVVTREVPPQRTTAELASGELGSDNMRFPGGGGGCSVRVEDVVEARGLAQVVPAVRGMIGTPDGGWWVERGVGRSGRRFDVFSAGGVYVGTLPPGTPRPTAFLDSDHFVSIERDNLERTLIAAYRIFRPTYPTASLR